MKPFAKGLICTALVVGACGCGGTPTRIWPGSRDRARVRALPDWNNPSNDPGYASPVEPPAEQQPQPAAPPTWAPPVNPLDLEPPPRPSASIRFDGDLPPPPVEQEDSVNFGTPQPLKASPMPNALFPAESHPILEQSSAERPSTREANEVLGEGKIALLMQGHSTFPGAAPSRQPARLMPIETEDSVSRMVQIQYAPKLMPVPSL